MLTVDWLASESDTELNAGKISRRGVVSACVLESARVSQGGKQKKVLQR